MTNKRGLSLQLFLLVIITLGLKCDFPDASIPENGNIHRGKRETSHFRGPYIMNQNLTFSYLKLVLVVDNAMYNLLGRNTTKVNQRYKNLVNIVNSNFQEYNIGLYVALLDIVIYVDMDRIEVSQQNIDQTSNRFKKYVKKMYDDYANNPMKNNHIDEVILMSGISFANGYDFFEWNQPCELSSGVIEDYNRDEDIVARFLVKVITTMSIEEDFSEECSAYSSYTETVWKRCLLKYLPQITEKIKKFKCSDDQPIKILNAAMCGNGFIEEGEQCDCGSVVECDNPCCNATTCMFKTKAFCAMGECCDLKTCKIRPVSTSCRPKSEDCDLPEYCDGQSEFCPDDVSKIIGTSCIDGSKCDLEKHKCKGKAIQCEEIHCNDNGVCNSKGHCHCNNTFAPPTCESPGFGGSIDSGPAPNLNLNVEDSKAPVIIVEVVGIMLLVISMSYVISKLFPLILRRYESYRNVRNTVDNPVRTVPSSSTRSSEVAGSMQYQKSGDVIFVPVFVPPPPIRKDCML